MAKKKQNIKKGKKEKPKHEKIESLKKVPKIQEKKDMIQESLIRVLSTDIPGRKNIFTGLTKIKGVSWSFSNAVCQSLKIPKNKKMEELSKEEIEKISDLIKNPKLPAFLMNRKKDIETGKDKHLIGAELDLQRDFDIKRLKKIKTYRGIRHILGQPVRGQKTKSHFRKNKTVGVTGKAKKGKKG